MLNISMGRFCSGAWRFIFIAFALLCLCFSGDTRADQYSVGQPVLDLYSFVGGRWAEDNSPAVWQVLRPPVGTATVSSLTSVQVPMALSEDGSSYVGGFWCFRYNQSVAAASNYIFCSVQITEPYADIYCMVLTRGSASFTGYFPSYGVGSGGVTFATPVDTAGGVNGPYTAFGSQCQVALVGDLSAVTPPTVSTQPSTAPASQPATQPTTQPLSASDFGTWLGNQARGSNRVTGFASGYFNQAKSAMTLAGDPGENDYPGIFSFIAPPAGFFPAVDGNDPNNVMQAALEHGADFYGDIRANIGEGLWKLRGIFDAFGIRTACGFLWSLLCAWWCVKIIVKAVVALAIPAWL